MASTIGKEKNVQSDRVSVQILKIRLNPQSHKTLNEGSKGKKVLFCIPSREHKETDGPNERVPC